MEQQTIPKQQPTNVEAEMKPRPKSIDFNYRGSGKLKDKVAVITGGDSGIGRAAAYAFALEGANVCIAYLKEHRDARETKNWIEQHGRQCLLLSGDVGDEIFCRQIVESTIKTFGRLDVLVNNVAEEHPPEDIEKISKDQLERIFRTNIFSYFYMAKAALPYLKPGSAIINTTSVNAYRGNALLIAYSSTKGAIVSFTRSLAKALVERCIRVNAVAPGPIWTPLITSTSRPETLPQFGQEAPMKRPGQPEEVAPSYVFLASDDSSYMSGQVLHPNGGEIING